MKLVLKLLSSFLQFMFKLILKIKNFLFAYLFGIFIICPAQ
jgi:hypothetical protein